MKSSIHLAILVVLLIILVTGCEVITGADSFTDTLELTAEKTTIEEASNALGIPVPMPAYLPETFKYQEVYLEGSAVRIIFSNVDIKKEIITPSGVSETYQQYEFRCQMEIEIVWGSQGIPGGLKYIAGGEGIIEGIEINPSRGIAMSSLIVDKESHNELWWEWRPDPSERGMFRIGIAANKSITKDELVNVAESFQ